MLEDCILKRVVFVKSSSRYPCFSFLHFFRASFFQLQLHFNFFPTAFFQLGYEIPYVRPYKGSRRICFFSEDFAVALQKRTQDFVRFAWLQSSLSVPPSPFRRSMVLPNTNVQRKC